MTDKRTLLYEGKAKNLYQTDDEAVVLAAYKDQATALNGKKKDQIAGKGELNNQITSLIFRELNRRGVHTHFIEQVSTTEQLNTKVDIIPLEVVVRNVKNGKEELAYDIPNVPVTALPNLDKTGIETLRQHAGIFARSAPECKIRKSDRKSTRLNSSHT